MSRLPVRVRLMAAFASAMLLMLVCAALFVYVRLRMDLDDAVNARLHARADVVAARIPGLSLADVALEDPEESFVQLLGPTGDILDTTGTVRGGALDGPALRAATVGQRVSEQRVAGMDGRCRVLARPVQTDGAAAVLVIGQSLLDRDEALAGVVTSFGAGGGVAVLLASAIGYLLGRAGLAPVEAMRRRALQVSLAQADGGLPLPLARDEVRRLGETLNEMLDRLRASFERERRFVADASHELRTPVAVVRTELEAAVRTGDYGPQVRESLLAAVEECDRLAQLADDLLALARMASDGLPLQVRPLRPRPLLDAVRDRFSDRAVQRGRLIAVQVRHDRPFDGDVERLRQALGNLVDNALRHGHGDVVLSSYRDGDATVLEVHDGGTGFGPDIAGRAFERFARGDTARSGGGAGLGLAIVASVARAHGGSATIADDARCGAAVRIRVPDVVTHRAMDR